MSNQPVDIEAERVIYEHFKRLGCFDSAKETSELIEVLRPKLCDEVEALRERVRELEEKDKQLKINIENIISPFDGIEHWEDCAARKYENEDDIDCNPMEYLEDCECSVKMLYDIYCIIKPPVEPTKGETP